MGHRPARGRIWPRIGTTRAAPVRLGSGSGFRVQSSGFRVQGSGLRVQEGGAGLLIRKHDHFTPARKMRGDVRALAARYHPEGLLYPVRQDVGSSETSSVLRLIDSSITQFKAQGPYRACKESKEEEEDREEEKVTLNHGVSSLVVGSPIPLTFPITLTPHPRHRSTAKNHSRHLLLRVMA